MSVQAFLLQGCVLSSKCGQRILPRWPVAALCIIQFNAGVLSHTSLPFPAFGKPLVCLFTRRAYAAVGCMHGHGDCQTSLFRASTCSSLMMIRRVDFACMPFWAKAWPRPMIPCVRCTQRLCCTCVAITPLLACLQHLSRLHSLPCGAHTRHCTSLLASARSWCPA